VKARSAGADRRQVRFPGLAVPVGKSAQGLCAGVVVRVLTGLVVACDVDGEMADDVSMSAAKDCKVSGSGRVTVPAGFDGDGVSSTVTGSASSILVTRLSWFLAALRRRGRSCDVCSETGIRPAWLGSTTSTWPIRLDSNRCWLYINVQSRTLELCPKP